MTPAQIDKLNRYIMIAGALLTIGGPLYTYLTSGEVINAAGVLAALGAGVTLWAKKAPGHLTPTQAQSREPAESVSDLPG